MAMRGSGAGSRDGIVCGNVEDSLANLGTLGNQGMREANELILAMMLTKQDKPEARTAG